MHEVLVNSLVGLSLPRNSVIRLTDRPDMTIAVYCGRKTTIQQRDNFSTQKLPRSHMDSAWIVRRNHENLEKLEGQNFHKCH